MDPMLWLPLILLVFMIFFMMRGNRAQQKAREDLQKKIVPGAQVMTQSGIFGTVITQDPESNSTVIESVPGTKLRVHTMTITTVVEDEPSTVTDAAASSPAEPESTVSESSLEGGAHSADLDADRDLDDPRDR